MNQAYRDLLEEMVDWREKRRVENVKFYADAIAQGRVSVTPGKEKSTRHANCDVCLMPIKPGARKFFYRSNGSFHFRVCGACWNEIVQSVPMPQLVALHALTVADLPRSVTSS
jgi:hypothetical protein